MRVTTYQHNADQVRQYKSLEKDLYYSRLKLGNRKAKNLKEQVIKEYKHLYNKSLIGLEQAR